MKALGVVNRHITWVTTPLLLAVFVAVWWGYVDVFGVSRFILPAPDRVGRGLWDLVRQQGIWTDVFITFYETIIGFATGSAIGIVVGWLVGRSATLERVLSPFIVATQVVPKVALVPLFILWFGFGPRSKIVIAALLCFFPLLTNVALGVKSIDTGLRDLMRGLGAGPAQRFLKLELPAILPYAMAGMEVGIVLAIIGAVVGEYLGGDHGLGFVAVQALAGFKVDLLFADIILLTALGFLLYLAVAVARRFVIPWHESIIVTQRSQG